MDKSNKEEKQINTNLKSTKEINKTENTIKDNGNDFIENNTEDFSVDLKNQIEELKDRHLRLMAEYDNYRRRTIQEKSDLILHGAEKTIKELLPVLDDLELAKKHISEGKDIEALRNGLILIMNKFSDFLKSQGITVMETIGKPFDSDTQQAVAMIHVESPEKKGIVIDCIKQGYKLHDKVLRFADVVVGQ